MTTYLQNKLQILKMLDKKTSAQIGQTVDVVLGPPGIVSEADDSYAPLAEGVTGGNAHDHVGGDGANITQLPALTGNGFVKTSGGIGTLSVDTTVFADYVPKSLFDAYTILHATADNTPLALTVAEQTLVGRITGGAIASLTVAQIKTLLLSSVVVVTDTYGILATDEIVICNKATAFTVTLPTTVVGKRYSIKSIGIGTVTLDGAGSDTIDGQLTQILGQWDNIDIACYVANTWAVE